MNDQRRTLRARWRTELRPRWRAVFPLVLTVIGITTLVLGTTGYLAYEHDLGRAQFGVLDAIYRLPKLFSFGADVDPPLNWQLQVARLLGPLLTGYAAFKGVLALTRDQMNVGILRLLVRDHVVIAGLGATGSRLAVALHDAGVTVAVLEQDSRNPDIQGVRDRGIRVLVGDATDPWVLRQTGIRHASRLVAVCGADGTNVDVAAAAATAVGDRRGILSIHVHLRDLQLWQLLDAEATSLASDAHVRLEYFAVYATAGRMMLERHPPFEPVGSTDVPRHPHLLLAGVEDLGEQVVLHAARLWDGSHPTAAEQLMITITGPEADADVTRLRDRYPALDSICTLDARPAAFESARFQRGDVMADADGRVDITGAYVCLTDEAVAFAAALALHARTETADIPVVVAVSDDRAGIAMALEPEGGRLRGIQPFGIHSVALGRDLLHAVTTEVIAQAKHAQYVRDELARGERPADDPVLAAWADLPESYRQDNRRFADGIGRKLALAGCRLVPQPLPSKDAAAFAWTEAEVDDLAREEHDRWMRVKDADGWRMTTGRKDDAKKLHPSLVPWEDLSQSDRDRDREPVRELPGMLAQAGFRIVRAGQPHAPDA